MQTITATPEAPVRRDRDTLYIVGTGILALCAWSLVKYILAYLQLSQVIDEVAQTGVVFGTSLANITAAACAFALVDLALHAFVGFSARAVGQGRQKGVLYLAGAVLLALAALATVALDAWALFAFDGFEDKLDPAISGIIDFTSLAMLTQLIAASMRLRKAEPTGRE